MSGDGGDRDLRAGFLRAIEERRSRLHPFGDVLGLQDPAPGEDALLALDDSPFLAPHELHSSALAINVGIDCVAARAAYAEHPELGHMATRALTTTIERPPRGGRLRFTSVVESLGDPDERNFRQLVCRARVYDEEGQVASGTMTALAIDLEAIEGAMPPKRRDLPESVIEAELDRLLATDADSLTESLLLDGVRLAAGAEGEATVKVRPMLENLVGSLQGGAAPSIADALARQLIGREELQPCILHWAFRGPIQESCNYELRSWEGAGSAHVEVRVTVNGRVRGLGLLDYRPEPAARGTV
jgi:acyl-coenzyme A thioesterase PaaI-like protein